MLSIIFAITPIEGPCYRVIGSPILQEFLFTCLKIFIMQ